MLRLALVLALALATITTAQAEDFAIRDRAGRTQGYVVERPGGSYAIQGRDGRVRGYVDPIPGTSRDTDRSGRRDDPARSLSYPEWWRARR